jgi:hypothetical protein
VLLHWRTSYESAPPWELQNHTFGYIPRNGSPCPASAVSDHTSDPSQHGFMQILDILYISTGFRSPILYPIAFPTYPVAGLRYAPHPLNCVTHPMTVTCATAGRKNRGERVFELGTRRSGSVTIVCRIVFCSAHTNSKHTCRRAVRLSSDALRHIKEFSPWAWQPSEY